MKTTPKGLRLHIGIFGRTNVGKSSLLNLLAGQEAAITSPVPGTTTDVVEKGMELLPLGPVVFLDTAGVDDKSELGARRLDKAWAAFDRCDVVLLVAETGVWDEYERDVCARCLRAKTPVIVVVNKIDTAVPTENFLSQVAQEAAGAPVVCVSSARTAERETYISRLKESLIRVCPEDFLEPPQLLGDLVPAGGLVVLIVPIDLQAPKGRLILPQVQAVRDAIDQDAACLVVKEREYAAALGWLGRRPDLVVCDSQVVLKMVADTPPEIPCTTFSILFSRHRGDLAESVRGAAAIDRLRPGDRVLIAEACSHHAAQDDIGRVKIPRWLRQHVGGELKVEVYAGQDFPKDLKDFSLVVHCGACMINRRLMLSRMQRAREHGVAVTNYGVAISHVQGVLRRVLSPFPAARCALDAASKTKKGENS